MILALTVAVILSWVVLGFAVVGLLTLGRAHTALARSLGQLAAACEGGVSNPLINTPLPTFTVSSPGKQLITSSQLIGQPTLLLFVSPTCTHCHHVIEELKYVEEQVQQLGVRLVGINQGDAQQMDRLLMRLGANLAVLGDEAMEATRALRVLGTPWGVAVHANGQIVGMGVLKTREQILGLASRAA